MSTSRPSGWRASDTLGLELIGDEIANDPRVRLIYLAAGADKVQLVQPNRPGPVADWRDRHGDGLHHVCFQVDDVPAILDELDGHGLSLVTRAEFVVAVQQ